MFKHRFAVALLLLTGLAVVVLRPTSGAEPDGGTPAAEPAAADSAAAFPPAPPELAENVQGLLDEGYQTGPKRLQAAQKKLASARNLAADDPRLDYAYGLVLLKHAQSRQAIVQFEAAVGRSGTAYWPAWQALIWSQLVEKQYDKGFGRLDEFAALVRKAGEDGELTDPQRDAARWMGQILEALDKTVTAKKLHELVEQHDNRLHEVLGDELYSTLQLGRDLIEERDGELSKQADASQASAEKGRARRKQTEADKLENDLKDLDKEKANTAKSAEEWKDWLDEALGKADKELSRLEKEYHSLETRSETLRQTITSLGRDLTALDLQLNTIASAGATGSAIQQTQQRYLQRQNQLVNSQMEYNVTIGKMSQTAQQGRVAYQQRAAIVQKYEKATGQLVKKNAELDKWSARVADKKKKLDMPAAKAKGARSAPERKVVSLKSFVPLDLDDEKARVLAAFGVSPDQPEGEPADDAKPGAAKQ